MAFAAELTQAAEPWEVDVAGDELAVVGFELTEDLAPAVAWVLVTDGDGLALAGLALAEGLALPLNNEGGMLATTGLRVTAAPASCPVARLEPHPAIAAAVSTASEAPAHPPSLPTVFRSLSNPLPAFPQLGKLS